MKDTKVLEQVKLYSSDTTDVKSQEQFRKMQQFIDASIQNAAEAAREAASPISDMRGTAEYRKHLCEVLTRRALNTAVERAGGK